MAKSNKTKFFYGYLIAAASLFIGIVTFGATSTFGVFLNPLLTEFGWTRAMISGALSLNMVMYGLFGTVTGRLNDRFGPKILISVCALILALGYFLMSYTAAVWQLYLFYGVIIGIGMSSAFVPVASTVVRWFVKRRGLMTGIVLSGTGLGTFIMVPIGYWLISNYGWRKSYIIIGIIVLVLNIASAQILKRNPEEIGQVPYGADEANAESLNLQSSGLSLSEAIHTSQFWMLCAMYFFVGLCMQTILVHIYAHVVDLEFSAVIGATVLSVIGGVSFGGRIVMGVFGDRVNSRSGLIINFVLMSISLLCLLLAHEVWIFYLFAVIFGFAWGGLVAIQPVIVAELFGLGSHGVIVGTIGFGFCTGAAIGPVLAGHIFDVTNSYQIAFLICFGAAVMGIILASLLRK